MVAGSDAVRDTDCAVLNVPPAGDAVTVGGVVSAGGVTIGGGITVGGGVIVLGEELLRDSVMYMSSDVKLVHFVA